jgi:K+-transporting ATPase KdpF subunit
MSWLYVVAGLIVVGLVIYLLVALLRPEELG